MAINRRFLRDLAIPREAAAAIMSAYRETVEALTKERDEALQQAMGAQELRERIAEAENARNDAVSERDEYKARWDQHLQDMRLTQKDTELREALECTGANPAVIPLLAGQLMNHRGSPDEAAREAQLMYPALFAQPQVVGVGRISPPTEQSGPLTHREISRMSEDEIIKRWKAVEGALSAGMRNSSF